MERVIYLVFEGGFAQFDPNGGFPGVPDAKLEEACGLLLPWAVEAAQAGEPMMDGLNKRYQLGFGDFEDENLVIAENGDWVYPEDPVLHPLVKFEAGGEELFIYQYAWVVVRNKVDGQWRAARMD